jgi:myosin-1
MTTIQFVKDPKVPRDDVYKSSTVHVPEGLPPMSESRPTPRSRPAPSASTYNKPRTTTARPSQGRPSNGYGQPPAYGQPTQTYGQPAQAYSQPAQASRHTPQNSRERAQPPPPPPPPAQPPAPAAPVEPIYRAVYDFQGQTASELSFSKGDVLDIMKKEGNGWWLAKKNGQEGWVPQNYLKEEMPAPKPTPVAPPPAPALRPPPSNAGRNTVNRPTANKPAFPNGPTVVSAPKPPAANGTFIQVTLIQVV